MRTLALPCTLIASAAISAGARAADAGPGRVGKVVRVERPPVVLPPSVRLCSLVPEAHATCDRPVQVGDVGVVVDDARSVGVATVRAVDVTADACGNPNGWDITEYALRGPSGAAVDVPTSGLLVFDVAIGERGRQLAATRGGLRVGEQALEVLDTDGDGRGDLRRTRYSCDYRGALEKTTRPTHRCTDYWLAIRDHWQRARTDRTAVCDR